MPPKQGRRAAPQSIVDDDIGSPDDLLDSPSSGLSPAKHTVSKIMYALTTINKELKILISFSSVNYRS